jgi:uncharacterized damage-inducible protein DinB
LTTIELVELLQHAYDGDPWHGPSLRAVLQRCRAETAHVRLLEDRHTIQEIVLHLTAWTREVERRLGGALADEPAEGDWPDVPDVRETAARDTAAGEAVWRASLDALAVAHQSLVAAVARQPDTRWRERVGDERNPAAGTGVSYGVMIVGLATHHAYHAGQMAILAGQ